MDNKKLQKLESIYVQMTFAYNAQNENEMKKLFNEFGNLYPEFKDNRRRNVNKIFIEHLLWPLASCPIELIFGVELNYNVEGCLRTIEPILRENQYQTFSSQCIQTLYFSQKTFETTDVLYETPKENNANSNTLKVSDLLSVAKYTLQVLKL